MQNNSNKWKQSIVIDLDDTLCFPNHNKKTADLKYALAKPNTPVIGKINKLYDNNWYIIINSARRMVTFEGDLEKIENDIGDLTRNWLKEHNVKYHELIFGKPYSSSYYVDDKALNVEDFLNQNFDSRIEEKKKIKSEKELIIEKLRFVWNYYNDSTFSELLEGLNYWKQGEDIFYKNDSILLENLKNKANDLGKQISNSNTEINNTLDVLSKVWDKYDCLRFGQLLHNINFIDKRNRVNYVRNDKGGYMNENESLRFLAYYFMNAR